MCVPHMLVHIYATAWHHITYHNLKILFYVNSYDEAMILPFFTYPDCMALSSNTSLDNRSNSQF